MRSIKLTAVGKECRQCKKVTPYRDNLALIALK